MSEQTTVERTAEERYRDHVGHGRDDAYQAGYALGRLLSPLMGASDE